MPQDEVAECSEIFEDFVATTNSQLASKQLDLRVSSPHHVTPHDRRANCYQFIMHFTGLLNLLCCHCVRISSCMAVATQVPVVQMLNPGMRAMFLD